MLLSAPDPCAHGLRFAVPVGAGSTGYGWRTPGVHGPEITGGNGSQRDAGFTLRTAVRAWSSVMALRFNSPLAHQRANPPRTLSAGGSSVSGPGHRGRRGSHGHGMPRAGARCERGGLATRSRHHGAPRCRSRPSRRCACPRGSRSPRWAWAPGTWARTPPGASRSSPPCAQASTTGSRCSTPRDVRRRRVRGAGRRGDRRTPRRGVPGQQGAPVARDVRRHHRGVPPQPEAPGHRAARPLPAALARPGAARGDGARDPGAGPAGPGPPLGRQQLRRARHGRAAGGRPASRSPWRCSEPRRVSELRAPPRRS